MSTGIRQQSSFLYFAAASAYLGAIALGATIGWSSPALASMEEPGSNVCLFDFFTLFQMELVKIPSDSIKNSIRNSSRIPDGIS